LRKKRVLFQSASQMHLKNRWGSPLKPSQAPFERNGMPLLRLDSGTQKARFFKVPCRTGCLFFAFLISLGVLGQTRYTYTGNLFTQADPPYTTSDRIAGFFDVAIPLDPFMARTDIAHLVTAFSFSDGQVVHNALNSTLCYFGIATDGAGHIIDWSISIRESFPLGGNPQNVIDAHTLGDQAGFGTEGPTVCSSITLSNRAYNASGGIWSDALPAGQSMTYTYMGSNFENTTPPYTTQQRIAGSFQVLGPLPPWLVNKDIGHALTNLLFSDGIQVRSLANSEICRFEVSTDGAGHIVDWSISLRQPGIAQGNIQQALDSGKGSDIAGSGPAGASPCAQIFLTTSSAITSQSGNWSDSLPPGNITDYQFQSEPFTLVTPPYQTTDFISGFLQFRGTLPPYFPNKDLSYALLDFEFDDGIQVRTPENSLICNLRITTDSDGSHFKWRINLREIPYTQGQPQQFLDLSKTLATGGSGNAGLNPCDMLLGTSAGISFDPGDWLGQTPSTPVIYLYTGRPFTDANPPFESAKKVSGRMVLPGPPPPNMQLTDMTDFLIDFRFNDSRTNYTPESANTCSFRMVTGGNGEWVQWQISLRDFYQAPNIPQNHLNVNNLGLLRSDHASLRFSTTESCARAGVITSASNGFTGSWTLLCPELLANFENWPQATDVLGLLNLNCPSLAATSP